MNQKGFSQHIWVMIVGAVVVAAGGGIWYYQQSTKPSNAPVPIEGQKPQIQKQTTSPKPSENPKDIIFETDNIPAEPAAKVLSFSWEKDSGSRITDGSVPFIYKMKVHLQDSI